MISFPLLNVHLRKFLECFKELENDYLNYEKIISKDILSPEWRKLTSLIFSSITAFSNFMDEFRRNLFKKNFEEFKYYAFYWDLLLSKIKHSFATEIPRRPFYLPTILFYEKVPILGEKLINYETETNKKRIPVIFLKLYMRLFLTYDFIFYKNEGVFTRFKLDKKFFEHIKKELFKNELAKTISPSPDIPRFNYIPITISNFLKNYLKNLIVSYIKESLIFVNKEGKKNSSYSNIQGKEVYKKFLEFYKSGKKLFFEPFTYFLAFKMWKYGKLLQTTFEFQDIEEREEFFKIFVENLEMYKNNQLKAIEEFYNDKITNEDLLKRIFETDKNFLEDQIFKKVLPSYETINSNNQFNSFCNYVKTIFTLSKEDNLNKARNSNNDYNKLEYIFNRYLISKKDYEKFSWQRFLEKGTAEEITLLLDILKNKIFESLPQERFQYIGVLRAGGLLAHCLNVMTNLKENQEEKLSKCPVVFFSSFPYLSFLPRDINVLKNEDLKNVPLLIVDESIKSGFTFSILVHYLKRTFERFQIQREVKGLVCLADIEGFERCNTIEFEEKIFPLAKILIEDSEIFLKALSLPEKNNKTFDWKAFFTLLHNDSKKEIFKKVRSYITYIIENNKRMNVTHILSNSILLFMAAKDLAKKLGDLKFQKLAFYSITDEGKILKDAIIFASKFLWEENNKSITIIKGIEDWEKVQKENESALIFIDMTIDTLHTFLRGLKIDLNKKFNEIRNSVNIKVATIFASKEAQSVLKDKLLYVENLRD